ncbi:MAG: hypothetical protein SGI74_03165 [Oligoflexia bacterium]|nr:hypothetical protein [Oligoflexia bacterium]
MKKIISVLVFILMSVFVSSAIATKTQDLYGGINAQTVGFRGTPYQPSSGGGGAFHGNTELCDQNQNCDLALNPEECRRKFQLTSDATGNTGGSGSAR